MKQRFVVFGERIYLVQWWGFAARWMVVRWHRVGEGWWLTVGPLCLIRCIRVSGGANER